MFRQNYAWYHTARRSAAFWYGSSDIWQTFQISCMISNGFVYTSFPILERYIVDLFEVFFNFYQQS